MKTYAITVAWTTITIGFDGENFACASNGDTYPDAIGAVKHETQHWLDGLGDEAKNDISDDYLTPSVMAKIAIIEADATA